MRAQCRREIDLRRSLRHPRKVTLNMCQVRIHQFDRSPEIARFERRQHVRAGAPAPHVEKPVARNPRGRTFARIEMQKGVIKIVHQQRLRILVREALAEPIGDDLTGRRMLETHGGTVNAELESDREPRIESEMADRTAND